MAKKTISMTLSSKSIQAAIKELEKYRDSLQAKCDLLVSRLAQIGQTAAIQHISESPLGNTITVRVDKAPQLMTSNAILIATGKTVTSEDREPFYTLLAVEFGAGIFITPKRTQKHRNLDSVSARIRGKYTLLKMVGTIGTIRPKHGVIPTVSKHNANV
jgi:hypothetical protein